jgi:hypothetical protein
MVEYDYNYTGFLAKIDFNKDPLCLVKYIIHPF